MEALCCIWRWRWPLGALSVAQTQTDTHTHTQMHIPRLRSQETHAAHPNRLLNQFASPPPLQNYCAALKTTDNQTCTPNTQPHNNCRPLGDLAGPRHCATIPCLTIVASGNRVDMLELIRGEQGCGTRTDSISLTALQLASGGFRQVLKRKVTTTVFYSFFHFQGPHVATVKDCELCFAWFSHKNETWTDI